MNIKFQKGTYRIALILGPITLKFISPNLFFFKCIFSYIGEKTYFEAIKDEWRICRFRIIRGLFANITEFFTWKTLKIPFLAPTYFSCGFFNIQKTLVGKKVNCPELIQKVVINLPAKRQEELILIHRHLLWDNSGWIKTREGIMLFDYGERFLSGLPLSDFFRHDREELEKILSKQNI